MSSESNTNAAAAAAAAKENAVKARRKDVTAPPPLALEDTLRDLAILRASNVDLATILASTTTASAPGSITLSTTPTDASNMTEEAAAIDVSVLRSYEFARVARAAIKVRNRGDVEAQVERVNEVRGKLEDVATGLRDE
ncbi:hypothetical protein BJY52DRAFT_1189807 [Lactarius psammicola]|nr:hypothetical protein BJY52DRAFT_1189807 [Lactarius psammicola]